MRRILFLGNLFEIYTIFSTFKHQFTVFQHFKALIIFAGFDQANALSRRKQRIEENRLKRRLLKANRRAERADEKKRKALERENRKKATKLEERNSIRSWLKSQNAKNKLE